MRILVTGNMGYVGPVLIAHLRRIFPNAVIIGYDAGWFADCLTGADVFPETLADVQYFGDVRDMTEQHLAGVDAVVQLAAVSNDPMGNRFEQVTEAINRNASVHVAALAAMAGVKHLVFASSCSVYGSAGEAPRKETDPLNPLTAYASSKIGAERGLASGDFGGMVITCLRFATACGFSPRLRLDLMLNDFVACALATGEISVLSDGSPWRPLIDVSDMARAVEWAIQRPREAGGKFLSVNVGGDSWNHQVRDFAHAVAAAIPGTKVSINAAAQSDKRSYQVDFGLFRSLAPAHQPRKTLATSIESLRDGLRAMNFADRHFRESRQIRMRVLDQHIQAGRLNRDLRWSTRGRS